MNIYFVGGEDSSFINTGGYTVTTSTSYYRSGYARCAVGLNSGSNLAEYSCTPVLGTLTSFWSHAYITTNSVTWNNTYNLIDFLDSSGLPRISIRIAGTQQLKISTCNSAGTYTDLVSSAVGAFNFLQNTPLPLDVFCNYSTSGQVQVYWNGSLIADTGTNVNVTTNSVTSLAQVRFQSTGGYSNNTYWSEFMVADTSTLGIAIVTLAPAAAGNTQSWTPSTLANINKTTASDSTFISTPSANVLSEWATSTPGPSGTYNVIAMAIEARVAAGATGPQHMEWVVRSGGADYTQGSVALSTGFQTYAAPNGSVWYTNPATSAAWTLGAFGSGFNIGIESLA